MTDANQPGSDDYARWRTARDIEQWRHEEALCWQASLQVWAARCRWLVSQTAAHYRELRQLEDEEAQATLQVRAARQRRLLSQTTEGEQWP